MYNKNQIVDDLTKLGVKREMKLMVHSSYKSIGDVNGGAKTIVEALKDCITPKGALMMPSFNHRAYYDEDNSFVFDILKTPTTNGIIPQTFIESENVFRSLNPTHSFAVWGDNAVDYVKNHHKLLTMGENSPLDLMRKNEGYVLLLGVNYDRNTLHHTAEQISRVPCLGYRIDSLPMLVNKKVVNGRTWAYKNGECPLIIDEVYGTLMDDFKLHRQGKVGDSKAILFKMQDCFELLTNLIKNGYKNIPPCNRCHVTPQIKKGISVESDWDFKKNALKQSSELINVDYSM